MTGGNLTVTNASFEGNFADLGGGLSVTGNSQLANVSFHNNTAASNGGGLYTTGNVSLTGVTFSGNHSVEGMGGAIASQGGTLAVTGSTFTNNNAVVDPYFIGGGGEGGAIYTLSLLTVTNSTF
jgi:predicted outer membrane repeat protein